MLALRVEHLQPIGAEVHHEDVPVRVGGERVGALELAVLLFALAAELALEVALAVEDLDTVVAFVTTTPARSPSLSPVKAGFMSLITASVFLG